ncbi:hypothetical protein N431DRAFT_447114 [Stipitochalara longipes BDJ]|nr:hypothetical protein N431DRAFT_447114 [Stipitochalara longipes BDJ]
MHFTTMIKGIALLATSSMASRSHFNSKTSINKIASKVLSAHLPIRDDSTTLPLIRDTNSAEVTPRASTDDPSWYVGHFCVPVPGQPWNQVPYQSAIDAIVDLRTDGPGVSVDPGICERLTCNSNAAIYWCNDRDFTFTSDTDYLADMGQYLALQCYVYDPPLNQGFTGGQIFDDWGMNIIIQAEDCANDRRTVKREELIAEVERRGTFVAEPVARDVHTLHSRDDAGHFCNPVPGQPWGIVDYGSVSQAINAISQGASIIGIGAGPGYCERLACVGDASIALCNDNDYFITVPSNRVVQMAQGIQGVCYQYISGVGAFTGGQLFDTSNFNVIVQQQNCGGGRRAAKREVRASIPFLLRHTDV